MSLEHITSEIKNYTNLITFNRPDSYNAMNRAMKLEIIATIKEAAKNNQVRNIILTGAGKAFSSGQDLSDGTVSGEQGPVDLGYTLETEWNPLINAIRSSEKIVIGALNGVCAGAGISVALACDLKIATPKLKLVSGFAQIGLAPDAGSSSILSHHLGQTKALEFCLLGEPLLADDLIKYRLINLVDENPLEVALKWADKLSEMAPLALKSIKSNLQFALDNNYTSTIERETQVQRFLGSSADYQEGISAFFEKRKPLFKGE